MTKDDEEFVRKIGQIYNLVLSLRRDEDFEVNQIQLDRLVNLYKFFLDKAIPPEDEVEDLDLVPREEFGSVTAKFLVFSLNGVQEVQKFCDVLQYCSACGMDVVDGNKVCIECTVPDVFVPRKNPRN